VERKRVTASDRPKVNPERAYHAEGCGELCKTWLARKVNKNKDLCG
jgi:hypothetical protein